MQPAEAGRGRRSDTLALLYQGILTGIVRIQTGRQPLSDLETFRRRTKSALKKVEGEAGLAGYQSTDIRDAEFAVVAFLDEAILSSKDQKAEEWRKRPLNVDLFGQGSAGDVFFDKLGSIEGGKDTQRLADLLEVYLLCLLLGFEGRFAPPLRSEAHRIMERLRERIERIRLIDYRLAPPLEFPTEPLEVKPTGGGMWHWWAGGALAVTILLFVIYQINLSSRLANMESALSGLR